MARIGGKPIKIDSGVRVMLGEANTVRVEGPKGALTQYVDPDIKVDIQESICIIEAATQQKRHKALQGLYRALLYNMVVGVTEGFEKKLEIEGIGYKADIQKKVLELQLGYAHMIHFLLPQEVDLAIERGTSKNPILVLKSCDKQLLGQVAAKIRSFRKPEPYKGKGIRVVGEYVRRKQGKTAG